MTALDPDRLYRLLPALYRELDAEEAFPLRALLRVIADQADLVEADIRELWDNLFIETCRPWVIPYIGDLVSNDLLFDTSRIATPDLAQEHFGDLVGPDLRPPVAARVRADVGKTIYYRRRKGTLPMLEELARDVTGWPAHAVAFFELLGWTQHLEHRRLRNTWTDLRSVERTQRIDGPFDEASHTVDVRPPSQFEGWHNISNVGFFLWRLAAFPLRNVPARRGSRAWRFHFSPLGNPAPLFNPWRREGDEAGLATERHVPAPIRHASFYEDLVRWAGLPLPRPTFTDIYGPLSATVGSSVVADEQFSFHIVRNGTAVPAEQVVCRRLDPWPATRPAGSTIGVDVERGRLAIGNGLGNTTSLDVSFHYGFPSALGGGPYDRRPWMVRPELAATHLRVKEDGIVPPGAPPVTHTSLAAALAGWTAPGAPQPNAIVTILDSRTYVLPQQLFLGNENWLVIEAASGQRPVLETEAAGLEVASLPPANPADPDRRASLTLSGVVLEGFVHALGDLGRLRFLHSTLVPGRRLREDGEPQTAAASLVVDEGPEATPTNTQLRVEAAFSITGPLLVPDHADEVVLLDCIVDGLGGSAVGGASDGPGPKLTLERTTILGPTRGRGLDASESIFTAPVDIVRIQAGCVRFSHVPPGSHTPRQYRCQPALAVEAVLDDARESDPALSLAAQAALREFVEETVIPTFTADRYGHPAYLQLNVGCPVEIRTGAEDGSEMGAFSHVKQPQRESNLRIRTQEYLPFGLDSGVVYVT